MPTNLMNTHEISGDGRHCSETRAGTPHPVEFGRRVLLASLQDAIPPLSHRGSRKASTPGYPLSSLRDDEAGDKVEDKVIGGHPNPVAYGFTLIEMLIVVAVIAILAALIIPITNGVHKTKVRTKLQTEKQQIITAIETYKAKRGHYPPDNPITPTSPYAACTNQLYYELMGTYSTNSNDYVTLDGKSQVAANVLNAAFSGKVGFVNCVLNTNNQEEVSSVIKCFRGGLQPNQVDSYNLGNGQLQVLVGSVLLPRSFAASGYPGVTAGGYLAWRYNSSNPTNNPGSFDLWIDVILDGKTNRISNWKRDAEIVNSP